MKVIQLSDLHFVKNLGTKQSRSRSRALGAKSHDIRTLSELGRQLQEIDYDLVLVSGDLATDGSNGALRHVRRFIEDEEIAPEQLAYVRRFTSARLKTPLKCLKAERYLVLPGNHDRYSFGPFGQIQKGSFRKAFPKPFNACPYVYVYEEQQAGGGREGRVVFVVLDSTWTRFPDVTGAALAVGRIDSDNLRKLTSVAESLKAGNTIKCEVTGKPYSSDGSDSTVMVVALHHHPVVPNIPNPEPQGRWAKAKRLLLLHPKSELTKLSNAEDFREACEAANVSVVMFGHQHLSYQLRAQPGGTLYSCCPTSTGFSERLSPWEAGAVDDSPGFLEYDFNWTNGRYELGSLTLYRWEQKAFVKRKIPLNNVPGVP
jgi:3',5'-cyclic AMP phosphodiesterase CpdA